jgi:hypothetical protein
MFWPLPIETGRCPAAARSARIVSHRAAGGIDHAVAEVAVDAVHHLDVELWDLGGITVAAIVRRGNMATDAERASLVRVLIRDGEGGMEDGVPGGLGHQADDPSVVGRGLEAVIGVAEHAVHRRDDASELVRVGIGLRPRGHEVFE